MKVWEKIVYSLYVIGWIIAPMIVKDLLASRNIFIPFDLAAGGIVIWYAIPLLQMAWHDRNKPKNKLPNSKGPSYTDKGLNDWLDRD